jgi:hypothetical protein
VAISTDKLTGDRVRQIIKVVQSSYTEPADFERAKEVLLALGIYVEDMRIRAERGRFDRWRWQCNAIVSHVERIHSKEWFDAKTRTEDVQKDVWKLEDWILGKTIGHVQKGELVVELNGEGIPVMLREHAEVMKFWSLDGTFTLKYDDVAKTMIIGSFQRHAPYLY